MSQISLAGRRLALIVVFALFAAEARAQIQLGAAAPEAVVTWSAAVAPPRSAEAWTDTFAPGERAFVTLTARVAAGWRVYALDSPGGLPLQLHLDALPGWVERDGAPGQTAPRDAYDAVLDEAYRYYDGEARVWQGIRLAPDAPPGDAEVAGRVRYAACNDEVCLPPREVPFRARLTVRTPPAP